MLRPARSFFLVLSAFLFLVAGLACVVGGAWLIALGGSWYYLLAGIALVAIAVLQWRQQGAALWLFALLFLATLVWALWEAGLDWWPLAARLGILFLLGLLLLCVRRRLVGGGGGAVAISLVLFVMVTVATWVRDPHTLVGTLPVAAAVPADPSVPPGEWQAYGRTGAGQRYSPLTAITPANVDHLQVAWHFETGDLRGRPGDPVETTFEVTPLKVGNRLYFCTPHQSVIALDATTGQQVWRYEPQVQVQGKLALQHLTCRGLGYQPAAAVATAAGPAASAATAAASAPLASASAPAPTAADSGAAVPAASGAKDASCSAKLFMPTADGRLIAINPGTGHVCSRFGGGSGEINLWAGMPNLMPGSYYSTSPPVVTKRLVIVGGTVLDNVSTKEQSGVIRAYDVDTGALVWNWDSGRPSETTPLPAGQTYTVNSPNSWSISAVDENLGLVYVPMGNQPPDQWGGQRSADVERYSSSVVALDLATGAVRWVYQTVHHDLWDYDVPAQPSLVDLQVGGNTVPALVQPTKQGELFVLDRRTGTPILPVTEQAAPQGAAQGDHTAPTQPKSALSFDPKPLTGADMWGATMFDQLWCRIAFHRLRYEGRFTPPSLQGSLVYPGNFGVFNWGGVAVDPGRGAVFATPDMLAFVSQLVPRPDATTPIVQDKPPQGALPALNENFGAPFAVKLHPFISPLGIPCQQPPWGAVAGADLRTGRIAWEHRNGTVRDLAPVPMPFRMGVPNLGGPIVTAGGVAFLSGTLDYYLRAYDVSNGKELWRARLPAGGQATPMTYLGADGRQYVLVVAGGHGSLGTKAGDSVIAYAVPR
ncbi:membrane-bound PQQ-dependent dehydrogenase, glucose/quinate/shikimate family [Ramlibacter sp. G-1-2-2]|uniref:Membrane-bound PQQ-dependent dehydrogenase, glucose/quinate/shikimate family n=1 Tax=Ramlibacter agri TaxID=2728837 RepID=A0A848H775_9BURK|nr:membrane-bound PQQ-dependent dehydrogenase, glucose/quinate/shikimate family [Ramlibacter agri]NML46645.1 membrane-bound PQQ-dependent dehydrogenase, glucose/quinate/shikimate family [Ramlibacter agri]